MTSLHRIRALGSVLAVFAASAAVGTLSAAPAHAAAATVGNGIATTSLAVPGTTPGTLATALVGSGVTVSNVSFTGAAAQAGLIHIVDPAVVAFNDGVILSSGDIANILGPNTSDGITGDMAGSADPDLNALIKDSQTVYPMTFDAAVLEFDFVPTASPVYFTYAFGSDEYLEWVNLFNDVFAFYVNGTNCATVPNGAPISIDTINDTVNSELFRDNSFSSPPPNPINIESDGLSVEMICEAAVDVGQVNHMKLAIADTSDQILDSVVILKAHSLSVEPPESCNDSVDNDDDDYVDMDDSSCTSSTTPPPTGSSGVGSDGMAPPFTGVEGHEVVLDAAALGWTPTDDTIRTTWEVWGINGTDAVCTIIPSTPQLVNPDGTAKVVTAICPADGEYTARIDGWDWEGGGSWDTDVDFFVQNAAPSVSIDTPESQTTVDTGEIVDLSASIADTGTDDSVSCTIEWGDGTVETSTPVDGSCTGSHAYAAEGDFIVSVVATDGVEGEGDSSASAVIISAVAQVTNTPPTADAGGPYSATEGSAVTLTGTASDADGDPVTTLWSITPAAGSDAGSACTVSSAASLSTSVVCNDNTTFTATLTASDGTASALDTAVVATSNAAPTTAITSPAASTKFGVGMSMSVSATIADAGSNDVLTCTVAWGDGTATSTGTVSAGVCSASHAYTAVSAGRTITVTATDDDGGTSSATRSVVIVAAPTVTGLSPISGPVGTTVTITGTNLTGASAVRFNGVPATSFTVSSATKITAVVAAGTTTGKVAVTTPGGTATSAGSFTVTIPVPTIGSFTPTSGGVGSAVTITGTNFTGATKVTINGFVATKFTVVSATTIVVGVPAGATSGKIAVTTPGGTAISKSSITLSGVKLPTISALSKTSSTVGGTVTVTGTNVGAALTVRVNGIACSFTVTSATTLVLVVAAGSTTGKVTVTTSAGTATSTPTLTIT